MIRVDWMPGFPFPGTPHGVGADHAKGLRRCGSDSRPPGSEMSYLKSIKDALEDVFWFVVLAGVLFVALMAFGLTFGFPDIRPR